MITTPIDLRRKLNEVAEAMNAPCRWPSCHCYAKRAGLIDAINEMNNLELPPPTQPEWDAVLTETFTLFACIGHRCRDLHERRTAAAAISHPVFAEFDMALERLAEPEAEPEPEPEASYTGPDIDPALTDYGPMFLGTSGKETLLQRRARHAAIDRQRRATLYEVPREAEAPPELEPKKATQS
jgi:hypothetical protein